MANNFLLIFSGLPGTGKSTLAREVCSRTGAFWLRIDTIETALLNSGISKMQLGGSGYEVAAGLAALNLGLGGSVVIDCVNPWPETRALFHRAGAGFNRVDVEVICSDATIHRHRIETRTSDIPGQTLPTWREVLARDYRAWENRQKDGPRLENEPVHDVPRIVIETSTDAIQIGLQTILAHLAPLLEP